MNKKYLISVVIIVLTLISGCSSPKAGKLAKSESMVAEYDDGLSNDSSKHGGIQTNRKIIQNAYVVMETLNFEEIISSIKETTYGLNGYFENMRVDGRRKNVGDYWQRRSANFRVRIPKDKYEEFMNSFGELGSIIVNELNSEDVTDQYIDTEARVNALKIQENRLLEIMINATDIEDIIALEERLSQVRYEIENFTGSIRKWDNLVEFTTIQLEIREVQEISEPAPQSLIERSIDQFVDSVDSVKELLQLSIIFLFGILPYLIIIIPIVIIINYLNKKIKKYNNLHWFSKRSKKSNNKSNNEK